MLWNETQKAYEKVAERTLEAGFDKPRSADCQSAIQPTISRRYLFGDGFADSTMKYPG